MMPMVSHSSATESNDQPFQTRHGELASNAARSSDALETIRDVIVARVNGDSDVDAFVQATTPENETALGRARWIDLLVVCAQLLDRWYSESDSAGFLQSPGMDTTVFSPIFRSMTESAADGAAEANLMGMLGERDVRAAAIDAVESLTTMLSGWAESTNQSVSMLMVTAVPDSLA